MSKKHEKPSREAPVELLNLLYPEGKEGDKRLYAACDLLGIDRETGRQARSRIHQKGSVETYSSLIQLALDLKPSDFKKLLPKIRKALGNPGKLAIIEELFEEARNSFGDDQVIAWLRLLQARAEIEIEVGIRKKPSRPKSKNS